MGRQQGENAPYVPKPRTHGTPAGGKPPHMSTKAGHMAQPMMLGQRRRGGGLGPLRLFQQGLGQQRRGGKPQPMRLGQRRRGGKLQPMMLGQRRRGGGLGQLRLFQQGPEQLRLFQQGPEQLRIWQQTGAVEAGRRAGAAENMAAEPEP